MARGVAVREFEELMIFWMWLRSRFSHIGTGRGAERTWGGMVMSLHDFHSISTLFFHRRNVCITFGSLTHRQKDKKKKNLELFSNPYSRKLSHALMLRISIKRRSTVYTYRILRYCRTMTMKVISFRYIR
jgi:hypothetical protein